MELLLQQRQLKKLRVEINEQKLVACTNASVVDGSEKRRNSQRNLLLTNALKKNRMMMRSAVARTASRAAVQQQRCVSK